MTTTKSDTKAFSTFRVLNGQASAGEQDQLFRNMAQLFSHVSERCDDEQVAQYDDVLCRLAGLVEEKARAHVAGILARLDRAPGSVVVKLANDSIDVARPLLEFSNVLSDDDLIEIVDNQTEDHREVIAGRESVDARVGDAIVEKGGAPSVARLVNNKSATFNDETLEKLVHHASNDRGVAAGLRGRNDIDWEKIQTGISSAGGEVLEQLGLLEKSSGQGALGTVSAVVYNRIRNSVGFTANEWKLAWNQVKALSDRRQLNDAALLRFTRFGYGHHTAAALTMLLGVPQEVLVKWLATQDYVAFTVACKAHDISAEMFEAIITVVPWRDFPPMEQIKKVCAQYEALRSPEASDIFDMWRSHAFRTRESKPRRGAA